MRKQIAILFISALSASLVACGSNTETAKTETDESTVSDSTATAADAETTASASAASIVDEVSQLTYEIQTIPMDYKVEGGETLLDFSYDCIQVTDSGYDALNASLDAMTKGLEDELKQEYDFDVDTLENTTDFDVESFPWTDKYTIDVVNADPEYLSMWVRSESYLGGAHPNTYFIGHTFDSATGEEIRLHDALPNYDDLYAEVLNKLESHEYVNDFFDGYQDTVYEEFYGDSNTLNWTEDSKKLYITFNDYDLAPHAVGPVFVDVDASKYPIK